MSHVRGSVAAESGHGAAAGKIKRLKIFGRLNNGVSVAEIKAALLHATACCGIPAGLDAFRAAHEVLVARRVGETNVILFLSLWEREGPAPKAWEGEGLACVGTLTRLASRATLSQRERV
jgi:hypothetical protein